MGWGRGGIENSTSLSPSSYIGGEKIQTISGTMYEI